MAPPTRPSRMVMMMYRFNNKAMALEPISKEAIHLWRKINPILRNLDSASKEFILNKDYRTASNFADALYDAQEVVQIFISKDETL